MIRATTLLICLAFSANVTLAGSFDPHQILDAFKDVCLSDNFKFGRKANRAARKYVAPLDGNDDSLQFFLDDDGFQITISAGKSCGIGASSPDQSFKPDLVNLQKIAIGTPLSPEPTVRKPRKGFTSYIMEYNERGRRIVYEAAEQKAHNGNNVVSYSVTTGF